MGQVQTMTYKRGFFGVLIKWAFIAFNILMVAWVISALSVTGEQMNQAATSAEQAGTAIGATLGLGLIIGLWVAGAIIGGIAVFLTRGKAIIRTQDRH